MICEDYPNTHGRTQPRLRRACNSNPMLVCRQLDVAHPALRRERLCIHKRKFRAPIRVKINVDIQVAAPIVILAYLLRMLAEEFLGKKMKTVIFSRRWHCPMVISRVTKTSTGEILT